MPLSEHEQRLFEQIERQLSEDPKFASAVRHSDPKFHARRRYVFAALGVLAGLAILVYGAATGSPGLGVGVGFVVMLAAAIFALLTSRRQPGVVLRSVDGTAQRRTRRGLGLIDRLESRWQDRRDFDR